RFAHNAAGPVVALASEALRLPNRDARVLGGYTLLGRTIDVVETSRGCTFDCSFCSIIEMRGRNFHPYPFDRVLADIADARAHGAQSIFLVDDNITLNVASIEAIRHLHANGMYVVGGLIVGNPDDTQSSIDANLEFARKYVDWPYIQHPTPYPGTPMTRDFQDRGLIVDPD